MNKRPSKREGRPTKYDPKLCDRVVQLGSQGYSKAMIACELGVVRQTLDNWCEAHPEFLDAMTRAREASLAWWERQGLEGIWSRDFNAHAYRLQVLNRFPDEWRDHKSLELHGGLATIDLSSLSDEQLQRIRNGEHPFSVLADLESDDLRRRRTLGPSGPDGAA
jgi:transposase